MNTNLLTLSQRLNWTKFNLETKSLAEILNIIKHGTYILHDDGLGDYKLKDITEAIREESNRLGKNTKIILIGGGASHELSFEDAIWYDNIMDIQKTGITDAYLIKDHKSNHYPLRDKIVGFSLGTDFDGMCFFKEKENEDIQGTSD